MPECGQKRALGGCLLEGDDPKLKFIFNQQGLALEATINAILHHFPQCSHRAVPFIACRAMHAEETTAAGRRMVTYCFRSRRDLDTAIAAVTGAMFTKLGDNLPTMDGNQHVPNNTGHFHAVYVEDRRGEYLTSRMCHF